MHRKACIHLFLGLLLLVVTPLSALEGQHPHLLLTKTDVEMMRAQRDEIPQFQSAYRRLKAETDTQLKQEISVPVPKDAGGGYTHEQHKKNYKMIHDAGTLYQLTGEDAYAERVKTLLLGYADLYPSLGEHPKKKEQSAGKLFWQSLNEAVWLVYSIQGYDAIVETLTPAERDRIEQNLFRPMAIFLSDESPQTFDKIHNHGTWAAAAVGMTGYVLNDNEMVQKALYGLDKSGDTGFLKQLDQLFSPDGYYVEGPYYQRYALMPFVLFAKAIANNEPAMEIFAYRDEILLKAIYTAIQLSYNNYFLPLNDALKDKGLDTIELIHGVAIAYGLTKDPALLSIAKLQHTISLSGDGLQVAKGLQDHREKAFPFKSLLLRDGAAGDQGALAILRSGNEPGHQALIMKNTAQGMGHGHFDKLNWLFYDNGHEIISDYGAARFLNVEAKYGGHYLPENDSWAKQTIAHNTLVVDESSHFDGDVSAAEKHHPTQLLFDVQKKMQIAAAAMSGAYPNVDFTRTMALINDPDLEHPLVLDILKVTSDDSHQYDLPLHYQGHIVNVNFPLQASTEVMRPLGTENGYQHLWLKAKAVPDTDLPQITLLQDNRFYTCSTLSNGAVELDFTELGANDPNFNLRKESAIIQRVDKASDHTFVSILETHGEYNPALEYTKNTYSQIAGLKRIAANGLEFIEIKTRGGKHWGLGIAYDTDQTKSHEIEIAGQTRRWQGFYHLFEY